jgi:tetratricopeptide (TPR) repeat protein
MHLENATLNPKDAEAHYQLGLIYQQRRQYPLAIEKFQKSVEIDPGDPDAYFQLGRIARQEGRYDAALEYCRAAARLDDKHCSNEVWREIGVVNFLSGHSEEARQALEKYLDRRPYDPEAQCWYGRTLAKLGLPDRAKEAFNQAIESVRTMPPARKRQVRSWDAESRKDLRALKTSAPQAQLAKAAVR